MKKYRFIIGFFFVGFIYGQDYEKREYVTKNDTLPYRLLLPKNYHPEKSYPLLIFLHGAGERGKDNQKQLLHGSSFFISEKFRTNYPAIIIFPQCPESSYWASVKKEYSGKKAKQFKFHKELVEYPTLDLLQKFLFSIEKSYHIDPTRRYIGGLSMGGMGTFELVARMPNYFAAAFSICGGGHQKWARKLKNTPFWIFHGSNDQIVSSHYSKKMFKKMKRVNDQVRLTIYKGVDHNSWDKAFKEPELFNWIFSFKKNK